MPCTRCGSFVQANGYCGTCGQPAAAAPTYAPPAEQHSWPIPATNPVAQPFPTTPRVGVVGQQSWTTKTAATVPQHGGPGYQDNIAAVSNTVMPANTGAQSYAPSSPWTTSGGAVAGPGQPYAALPPYMVVPQPGYAVPASGKAFSIAAFAFAAVALFIVPILFGVVSGLFATMAKKRGERWADIALRVAVASTGFGMVVGAIVRTSY